MNEKERLNKLFAEVGIEYGYDDVQADYTAFRDFKLKWCRSYKWISFDVSDYMTGAPDGVLSSLAGTVFRKIRGESDTPYDEEVCEWLTSEEFVRTRQPLYVRRSRGLSLSPKGRVHDLSASYRRLVDAGLVEEDPQIYLGWAAGAKSKIVGHSSVLMKAVAMSGALDSGEIPEPLLDYCLYSQVGHIGMGFNPRPGRRGEEYDAILERFPGRKEHEDMLRRLSMHV